LQEAATPAVTITTNPVVTITTNPVAIMITTNKQVLPKVETGVQVELLGLAEKVVTAERTSWMTLLVRAAVKVAMAVSIKKLMAEIPMAVTAVMPMVATLEPKYSHTPKNPNKS
jgi:hypothetical protein